MSSGWFLERLHLSSRKITKINHLGNRRQRWIEVVYTELGGLRRFGTTVANRGRHESGK